MSEQAKMILKRASESAAAARAKALILEKRKSNKEKPLSAILT